MSSFAASSRSAALRSCSAFVRSASVPTNARSIHGRVTRTWPGVRTRSPNQPGRRANRSVSMLGPAGVSSPSYAPPTSAVRGSCPRGSGSGNEVRAEQPPVGRCGGAPHWGDAVEQRVDVGLVALVA